jgi:hypothetical protein
MRPVSIAVFLIPLLVVPAAQATDHFLTVGGGYAPAGNQVSIERNVLFFRNVLSDTYGKDALKSLRHDVFFSDGKSPGRDVQFDDPQHPLPEAYQLLARLSDEEDDLGYRYRTHEVPDVNGPARRRAIRKWFGEIGAKIPDGDRLIIYVTGHGSADEDENGKKTFDNNLLDLWNGDSLSVRQFGELLDMLPQRVSVVVVMVQCYSGGFADLMYAGGDSQRGIAKANRCGFFATMPDRQAAGCTASVNEAGYEDYSSSFWAAIRGSTRTGIAVPRESCDFDKDGVITFAEAHAHVLLTDDSIDVPTTTSDRFLRLNSDPGASRSGGLVNAEEMLARLEGLATPSERAVIEGLSKQLSLSGQYRYQGAREMADSLQEAHKQNKDKRSELKKELDDVCDRICDGLEVRWPELHNRWDPAVDRILREEGGEVVKAIKSNRNYAEFDRIYIERNELASKDDALEAKWARCQRLMHRLERIALAHNLAKVGDEPTREKFKAILAAESGTLGARK